MSKYSEHFTHQEFVCHCGCGDYEVVPELIQVLEDVRQWAKQPVIVVSGKRCKRHNTKVGGANASQHMYGKAADITVKTFTPVHVYKYLDSKYPDKFGIGLYDNWVHIDVRRNKTRWITMTNPKI